MKSDRGMIEIFVGVFFTSLSILMLELILTRVFSVTLWYHFAFFAIAVALFGMSTSGIFLYAFPTTFPRQKLGKQLWIFSILFSASIPIALWIVLAIPFRLSWSWTAFASLAAIYLIVSVPFFLGGVCLALVLTHLSRNVSKIYFYDLIGAGIGCLLTIPLLNALGGPTSVLAIALFAGLSTVFFALYSRDKKYLSISAVILGALALLTVGNATSGEMNIKYGHAYVLQGVPESEREYIYDGWNSFSRVTVLDLKRTHYPPGLSATYQGKMPRKYMIQYDGSANTPIIEYSGNLEDVEYLKYTVASLAYHIRDDADACIIGVGGGRDVLTALVFGSKQITGIEINPDTVDVMENKLAAFSGNVYHIPGVRVVLDEGRSWIRRSKNKCDIIEVSLIDTWAATSAGAFTLSENNLYTVEAFVDYLNHLNPDGILTMSRWFFEEPRETLRLVSLGLASLEELGIKNPGQHIIVVRSKSDKRNPHPLATVMMKRSPFTEQETKEIERVAESLDFEVIYTPLSPRDSTFVNLITSADPNSFYQDYEFDVSPPSDDKPFFFYTVKPSRVLLDSFRKEGPPETNNNIGILLLVSLLVISLVLTSLFIVAPLVLFKRKALEGVRGTTSILFYFACLGLGFIMIEIALMQKFILFLGHPIYALTVVLFSLLLSSGVGSYLTSKYRVSSLSLVLVIAGIEILLVIYMVFLPFLFDWGIGYPVGVKILITIALLWPLGILMGMPFPTGIKVVSELKNDIIPWVWGINGAASVLGSVLALVLAISFGYTLVIVLSQLIYLSALLFGTNMMREELVKPARVVSSA
jgi:spermidine synthase